MTPSTHRGKEAQLGVPLLAAIFFIGSSAFLIATPVVVAQSTVKVSIQNFAFNPGSIIVVIGVNNTVTWTNLDSVYHTVTSNPTGSTFNSGSLGHGSTFTFTFTAAGTFGYHCSIHPFMTGTVVVIAGGSTTTSTTSTATSSSSSASTTSTSSTTSSTTSQTSTPSATTSTIRATSTSSTTASKSPTTSTSSAASSTSSSSSGGGIPEFPFQGVAVAVVAALVLASYLVVRQTKRD